jgi:hypothetical protein
MAVIEFPQIIEGGCGTRVVAVNQNQWPCPVQLKAPWCEKKESVTLSVSRWPVLKLFLAKNNLSKGLRADLSALIVEFCEVITID